MHCQSITVLKFGSSVLRTEQDLPRAVHEIYRWVRQGERVIAVVSAFGGITDDLIEKSRTYGAAPNEGASAALIATGEATAAALMALALDRAGIPAAVVDAAGIGLITEGGISDAELVGVSESSILRLVEQVPVVVVPGFVGRSSDGAVTLLGRGGTDLTALFLAQRLKAERCRLVKDVDGLYESDPAGPGPRPHRYSTIRWEDALGINGKVVQHKAIRFARQHQMTFEVAALQSDAPTLVGGGPATFYSGSPAHGPLKVGLLGLGTVGLGVYQELMRHPELFTVVGVAVRHLNRADHAEKHLLTCDPWQILKRGCDVIVEVMGGQHPATALIAAALEGGTDVVTANKSVLAVDGPMLSTIAKENDARLLYSSAVGGAVPMLEILEHQARRTPVRFVSGILNGTCNFILDETGHGEQFLNALAKAQEFGLAEADPSLDLDGTDVAEKLVLIARTASGSDFPALALDYTGILDQSCRERVNGHVMRLVAMAEITMDAVSAKVEPRLLPPDHLFAQIHGESNCLLIELANGQSLFLHGKGVGRWPTTEAVFADLLTLNRHRRPLRTHTIASHRIADEASHPPCSL